MPDLTYLAKIARSTGYTVVEVDGRKTRGRAPMGTIKTVVCHQTAGPKNGNYPSLDTVRDGRPGLTAPLAQFGIGPDGTIHVIAAGLAYHAGAVRADRFRNVYALGIEAENTGLGETWPGAQLDAYVKLCAALVKAFSLDVTDVAAHKEVCAPVGRKPYAAFINPAITMAQFRGYVRKGYYTEPPKRTPPRCPSPARPARSPPASPP